MLTITSGISGIGMAAASAASPSLGLMLLLGTLALGTLLTAGAGTVRLMEGMRTAELSVLWEANKLFLVAVGCAAAITIIMRLADLDMRTLFAWL